MEDLLEVLGGVKGLNVEVTGEILHVPVFLVTVTTQSVRIPTCFVFVIIILAIAS
jgi:hypothetical protein